MRSHTQSPRICLICLLCLITATFALPSNVASQAYPTRPSSIIYPFAPGGSVELGTRAITTAMSETHGQLFVLVSKP
jgi:tripartite-type tricarboxylate transporter receptor subunit TctC